MDVSSTRIANERTSGSRSNSETLSSFTGDYSHQQSTTTTQPQQQGTSGSSTNPAAMRRLRHSEVVLVDDVIFAYQNYWLRLRSPGSRGGFAGFICLESTDAARGAKKLMSTPPSYSTRSSREESEARDGGKSFVWYILINGKLCAHTVCILLICVQCPMRQLTPLLSALRETMSSSPIPSPPPLNFIQLKRKHLELLHPAIMPRIQMINQCGAFELGWYFHQVLVSSC